MHANWIIMHGFRPIFDHTVLGAKGFNFSVSYNWLEYLNACTCMMWSSEDLHSPLLYWSSRFLFVPMNIRLHAYSLYSVEDCLLSSSAENHILKPDPSWVVSKHINCDLSYKSFWMTFNCQNLLPWCQNESQDPFWLSHLTHMFRSLNKVDNCMFVYIMRQSVLSTWGYFALLLVSNFPRLGHSWFHRRC